MLLKRTGLFTALGNGRWQMVMLYYGLARMVRTEAHSRAEVAGGI
jgi:hypothetical protein